MEFDKKRYSLFSQSYVASALAEAIRTKHGISKQQSKLEWLKRMAGEHLSLFDDKWKEIFASEFKRMPEVAKVADRLGLSESVLMSFVLYGNISDKPTSRCEIFNANEKFPISHTGTYIRVDAETTETEIESVLKEAKEQISLVNSKNEANKGEKYVGRKRKDVSKQDEANGAIFIAVENKIKELVLGEKEKIMEHGYAEQIVTVAIEQVVGDTMTDANWEDESIEEELRCVKLVKDVYYSTMERYILPTFKDLKSILRVISS